jgi:hypothetical protein
MIDIANRLIVFQRLAVAASCVIFYVLAIRIPMTLTVNLILLVTLTFLACVEKLCSILNMVSVEKDWVCLHRKPSILLLTKIAGCCHRRDRSCVTKKYALEIRFMN